MKGLQVLLVAGTHGNEINAPWLFRQLVHQPNLLNTQGLNVFNVIGNPEALKVSQRYLDCDLNRSFLPELLLSKKSDALEVVRARELVSCYGPKGYKPCQIAIDLHSTTSAMGCSLVVYGRRPADLALASLVQARLGIPIYLHEADEEQQGFLVESWPCGFVIEIGPVPQNVLLGRVIHQTRLAVQVCLNEIAKLTSGVARFPESLVIHRHLNSVDFPRDCYGQPEAFVHPERQDKNWVPLKNGDPLFLKLDGEKICFSGNNLPSAVFINEAAYMEKNITMSFAQREIWPFSDSWKKELINLISSETSLI